MHPTKVALLRYLLEVIIRVNQQIMPAALATGGHQQKAHLQWLGTEALGLQVE